MMSRYFYRTIPRQLYRSLMTFEGQLSSGGTNKLSDEEKISKIFGSSTKGKSSSKPSKSTSRYIVEEEFRIIAGIKVPHKPKEPDNCCMSGCVNCVWEYYNEDLRHWKQRRRTAIKEISNTNEIWPEDWDPPIDLLSIKNLPISLYSKKLESDKQRSSSNIVDTNRQLKQLFPSRSTPLPQTVIEAKRRNLLKKQQQQTEEDEGWADVPIYIKVFAQFERKKRLQRQREKLERRAGGLQAKV